MSGSVPVRRTSTGAATATQVLARGTPESTARTAASHTRVTAKSPDRRTRKTQTALHNALITLLNGKQLNQITITELTRQADVNRATFYAHYSNVYDLFRHVEEDFMRTCKDMIQRHSQQIAQNDYAPLIAEIFTFFDEHERLFSIFVGTENSTMFNDLIDRIHEALNDVVNPIQLVEQQERSKGINVQWDRATAEMVRNYQFDYIAGGVVNILRDWFMRGRREPVTLMARLAANTTLAAGIGVFEQNLHILQTGR